MCSPPPTLPPFGDAFIPLFFSFFYFKIKKTLNFTLTGKNPKKQIEIMISGLRWIHRPGV